ncbi:hypothetical protein CTEN210_13660 [Chaetoceros tenuissimus]|uniref:Leucine-rich repeat domain-containing protein n=1 Tax=Chaetoceros tenuissimus TaxID=426638 RepID=A0AAD3HBL6_9STRA|nr:hypothetical protein CTEN210_13660 [Chaetoceros tenuissimus]
MRISTEEWNEIVNEGPGVGMYKGMRTLFWDGRNLWDRNRRMYVIYDEAERQSWQVIIVLPGVEIIPKQTFHRCWNVKTVIMADTVRRIEEWAFSLCNEVECLQLSTNLEYIGENAFMSWFKLPSIRLPENLLEIRENAFQHCNLLTSIIIPRNCRVIGDGAFSYCTKLLIFNVPANTVLGRDVIYRTALMRKYIALELDEEVNTWIKNINNNDEDELHRACSSFNPNNRNILNIVQQQGLKSLKTENMNGITASEYLCANPFANITERMIIETYILKMVGEQVP